MPANDFDFLIAGAQKTYRLGQKGYANIVGGAKSSHHFHEWRKDVKYLYHQMEILTSLCQPKLNDMVTQLELLAYTLGTEHDLAELGRFLSNEEGKSGDEPSLSVLLNLISRQQLHLQSEVLTLGNQLFSLPAQTFADQLGDCVAG